MHVHQMKALNHLIDDDYKYYYCLAEFCLNLVHFVL